MSRFRITRRARADLHGIWDYIGVENDNPAAAEKQVATLYDKFVLLAQHPLMGQQRDDLRSGLRAFAAGHYVILYYAMKDGIEVIGVVHGAQDIESLLGE